MIATTWRTRVLATAAVLLPIAAATTGTARGAAGAAGADDTPAWNHTVKGPAAEELRGTEEDASTALLRDAYYETRVVSGDQPLSIDHAGALRASATKQAHQLPRSAAGAPTFGGAWSQVGPNPIVQVTRTTDSFAAMSGRVSALAYRTTPPYTLYLGGAQGGVWTYDATSGTWTPRTDNLPSLSVGDIALAPTNQDIVYLGSGEGNLSGDSYYGDGVYRSTDAGTTWTHVSGSAFHGVSISRLVVDPTDANHLYAAVIRGRDGLRRVTPPSTSSYGIWESSDGGSTWTLLKGVSSEFRGATDLEIDPQNPSTLYASFWGDQIYKSTDSGAHWSPIMTGLPADADYPDSATRFSLGISHPAGQPAATLYTGFDWYDTHGDYHRARIFKSTDDGATWTDLPAGGGVDDVEGYCGSQCWYDNVVTPDPNNPDVVFAAGMYNYGSGSGGIYRSTDGGQTWLDLGADLHPDFHALAFNPAQPGQVAIGNDGGVWQSVDYGGRPSAGDPLTSVDWEDLNGTVDPISAGVTHRTGLSIAQFTSIANNPQIPNRVWGGTQDNGTLRKSSASNSWFDVASGDGGQVLTDPNDPNFVFGTYYGISPYRYTDGGLHFFSNESITNGIDTGDRSEFYVPWVMNQGNPDQLFLGTYRLYRTDNAEAPSSSDVEWTPISGDLTSGCHGTAPNGARGCVIGAIGVSDGGDGVYVGSDDGVVSVSPNAVTSDSPTWTRVKKGPLPNRPISQFAVDHSNWRIAYAGYGGYDAATPKTPGHVFKTTNGGKTWSNVSGDLPDAPVNSILLDPSFPKTLYAGTDVGAFVTRNGGQSWQRLGTGMPQVSVWQLALDPTNRNLRAGTHGRGAFTTSDNVSTPALVLSTDGATLPVGPGSTFTYHLTVRNIGNADATGVKVTDPVPAHTSFVSASDGGKLKKGKVTWTGLTVPAGGSTTVGLTVRIADNLPKNVRSIVNDHAKVTSAQRVSASGSPETTPIAPAHGVALTPATQTDGNKVGQSVDFPVTLRNLSYNPDSYALSTGGDFPATTLDASCSTPLTTTPTVAPGDTLDVCVRVDIPAGATDSQTAADTVTATSTADSAAMATATVNAIAVTDDTLLVDGDENEPDVAPYYQDALTATGTPYDYWDLASDDTIGSTYLSAHGHVIWFTGNAYPGPILPYESQLATYLDNGGKLFMSGQDILDQSAGTTPFVHDYLHINWDGSETQNDKPTTAVHGVSGTLTDGVGSVPLDTSVLDSAYMDEITPTSPAASVFTDDAAAPDGLSVDTGTYKVVFLAFPFEEYGAAADKADLMQRVLGFLG